MKSQVVLLRVFATISVVIFHSLGYYTYAWPFDGVKVSVYQFYDACINKINMPLFVAISGYLYQVKVFDHCYTDTVSFVKNKFRRLIIPYVFWGVLQLLLFPQTTNYHMLITGILHLWFLLMIFDIFIIMRLMSKWTNHYTLLIILFIITFVLSIIPSEIDFLCINAVVHYFPFFILGMIIARDKKKV